MVDAGPTPGSRGSRPVTGAPAHPGVPDPADLADIATLLAGVPLLAGLPADRLRELATVVEPVTVRAGEVVFHRGDPGESLLVVRTGRVEIVLDGAVVRVHGRGDSFGEVALLVGGRRSATVRARRDTELLALHRAAVERLLATEPAFAVALVRDLARRLPGVASPPAAPGRVTVLALVPAHGGLGPVLPRLADGLLTALGPGTVRLDATPDPTGWAARLDIVEAHAQRVLLVADAPDDAWARFCLRQADRPLLVADVRRRPDRPPATPQPGRLVALCPPSTDPARPDTAGLGRWLDALAPTAHHVVGLTAAGEPDPADLARAARRLTGRALGLALSGGGARGVAHLGVLAELEHAGVTVDRVGGTSFGSLVAGLYAMGATAGDIHERARVELVPRRLFGDVVFPRHALIRGRRVDATLARLYAGALIEDQRRRLFAVSVDLVTARKVVHRRGPIADAVGLSIRIPGVLPPRRVGDRVHVDGGVLDNLPIGEMADEGEGPVVAVDVGQPFAPGAVLPSIVDTIGRSMMIAGGRRDAPDRKRAVLVVTPRLDGIGMFDFARVDELVDRGREAARAVLADLRAIR